MLKRVWKFLIGVLIVGGLITGIIVINGNETIKKTEVNSETVGSISNLDETKVTGTTTCGIPWYKATSADEYELLDSDYAFSYKFISGVTTPEPFGFESHEEDYYHTTLGNYSILPSDKNSICRITDDSQKGNIGIIYHNVGTYQGKTISLKFTVMDWGTVQNAGELTVDGVTYENYPCIRFHLDLIGIDVSSLPFINDLSYKYEFFDEESYVSPTEFEKVAIKGHETMQDVDAAQYVEFYSNENVKKLFLSYDSDLKVSGNRIYDATYSDGPTPATDLHKWLTFVFEGDTIEMGFNSTSHVNDSTTTTASRRTFFYAGMVANTFMTYDVPEIYKSVLDYDNSDEITYRLDFYVPAETDSGKYQELIVTDSIANLLDVVDVSIYSDLNDDLSNIFEYSVSSDNVLTVNLKASAVNSFMYNANYTIEIKCKTNSNIGYFTTLKMPYGSSPTIDVVNSAGLEVRRITNPGSLTSNPVTTNIPKNVKFYINYIAFSTNEVIKETREVETFYGDKVFEDSYIEDIEGYIYYKSDVPEQGLHCVSGTEDSARSEINLYYKKINELSYTVRYVDKNTNKDIKDPTVVKNVTFKTVVYASAYENTVIEGYAYDSAYIESITVGRNENVIVLFYNRADLTYRVNWIDIDTGEVIEFGDIEDNVYGSVISVEDWLNYEHVPDCPIHDYTYVGCSAESIVIGTGENVLDLYYKKRTDYTYTVNYYEKGTTTAIKAATVVENVTFKTVVYASTYKDTVIDGYIYDSVSVESITIGRNENVINIYYNKRTDLKFRVNYIDKDTGEIIEFGNLTDLLYGTVISAEDCINYEHDPDCPMHNYVYDSCSADSVVIGTGENILNLYYTKRTDLSYTVNFKDKDTGEVIFNNRVSGVTYGTVVKAETYRALRNSLEKFYVYDSCSIDSIVVANGENVLDLYYVKRNDLQYTVRYKDLDTVSGPVTETSKDKYIGYEDIIGSKVVNNVTYLEKIDVSKEVINLDGYVFNRADPESELVIDAANKRITVLYNRRTDLKYIVNYLDKDTNTAIKDSTTVENVTLKARAYASNHNDVVIDGYVYDSADNDSIVIGVSDNVINLYYTKRNDLRYKVNYLEMGTTNNVIESKVVGGKNFKDVVTASEEAIQINGYNYSGSDKTSIVIGTNEDDNVINLYYTKQTGLSYSVKYVERKFGKEISAMKTVGGKTFGDAVEASVEVIFINGYVYDGVSAESITIGTGTNELIVYYTKQTGLSYEVNYFEKGTTNVLSPKKTVGRKTFEDIVYASGEVISIDGYKYDSVSSDSIVIGTESNVINVYYTKRDDLSYIVNYYEKGTTNKIKESKKHEKIIFETPITAADKAEEIEGFKYESNSGDIVIGIGENVIDLYYTRKEFNYTVEYYYDEKIDEAKTDVLKAEFEAEINSYADKNIMGYKLYEVEGTPLTISSNPADNVIKVYYIIDKENTKNISYSVDVTKDGVKDEKKSFEDEKNVQILTPNELDLDKERIQKIIDDGFDGYKLDKIIVNDEEVKDLPDSVPDGSIIKIEFVKRTDLSYTVNYYEKDTPNKIKESKTKNGMTFETPVSAASEAIGIDIDGFEYESNSGDIVIGTGENVIDLYYTRKEFNYTVEYYYDEKIDEAKTDVLKAEFEAEINSYADKNIMGYKLYEVEGTPLTISSNPANNVIKVYYIIDRENTKNISYSVDVIKDGVKDEKKSFEDENNVHILAPYELDLDKDRIQKIIDDGFDGYRLDKIIVNDEEVTDLPDSVPDGSIIKIEFVKRDDLSYTINYLDKDSGEAISDPKTVEDMVYGDEIKFKNEVIKIYGYDFVGDEEDSIVIGTGDNVINLYYELKDATVVVRYVDKDSGNYVLPEEKIDGKVFDEYEIPDPDNVEDKYQLVEKSDNYKGDMTEDEIVVIYTYELKTTSVTVHHYIEGTEEKLSDDIVMYDKVDKYYTTFEAYDVDSKWELAVVPANKNGIMTVEPIEVIYYYRKKAARVTVHYYEEGTVNKLSEDKVIDKRVDDEYETIEADDVPIKYELDHVEGETTGTMTEDEIVVTYYYKVKDSQLIVRHWDKATGEKIQDDEVFIEKVDFEYKLTPSEIDGYDLIEHTGNETGSFTVETQYVDYYYSYKSSVVVKYVDKNTGEVIEEVRHDGHEGDEVIPEVKNIDGYVLVEKPEDEKFDTTKEEKEVIYYYVHVSEGVVEKHIDVISGDIIYNEVHTGNEGDSYKIDSKENDEGFEKYDLVEDKLPDNAEGVFTKELIEVVYYYNYESKVIVRYVDKITGEDITDPEVIDGHEGDEYETEEKDLEDYKLVEAPKDSTMDKGDNEVIYYYVHDSEGVRVRHIDINSDEQIVDDEIITGFEGDSYKTEAKTRDDEGFERYDLVEMLLPDNAEGKMAIEETVVTYYYIKQTEVTIKYIDKVSGDELGENEAKTGHEGDEYTSNEKKFEGYDLIEEPVNKNGTFGDEDTEVIYYYARPVDVVVNYIDKETDLAVEESERIEGHEGDEYKIEPKNLEYYKLVEEPYENEGIMTVGEDGNKVMEINFHYVKKEFNLNMDKKIVDVLVNGTSMMNGDGEIAKVEINQKNLLNSEIVAKYVISVDNDSEIEGSAVIEEQIPNGMVMRQDENTEWKVGDKTATLVTEDIKPGEKKTYEVTMRWVASADNIGTLSNIATVTKTSNAAGFDEVTEKDNQDMADLIVSVATGSEDNDYTIIYMTTLVALMVLAGVTVVTLKKE